MNLLQITSTLWPTPRPRMSASLITGWPSTCPHTSRRSWTKVIARQSHYHSEIKKSFVRETVGWGSGSSGLASSASQQKDQLCRVSENIFTIKESFYQDIDNNFRRGEWDDAEALLDQDIALLGTDLAFFSAFLTSFLFNWVGFLLLMCFCHTIAARYGALAGFGLSLAKWTLIVKRNTELVRDENAWLWWLVLAFGFLICVRACTQFIQIKRSWRHLSTSARERLFFFY